MRLEIKESAWGECMGRGMRESMGASEIAEKLRECIRARESDGKEDCDRDCLGESLGGWNIQIMLAKKILVWNSIFH